MVEVNVKIEGRGYLPQYKNPMKDGGMDIKTTRVVYNPRTQTLTCYTGVTPDIPSGYVGLILPHRSIGDRGLISFNSCGIINSGEDLEIILQFKAFPPYSRLYNEDDSVGTFIILPFETVMWVNNN